MQVLAFLSLGQDKLYCGIVNIIIITTDSTLLYLSCWLRLCSACGL